LVVGSDGAFYAASALEFTEGGEGGSSWNEDGVVKLTSAGTYQALGGTGGYFSPGLRGKPSRGPPSIMGVLEWEHQAVPD